MENQIHLKTENGANGWLFGIVNGKEADDSLLCDYSRATGVNMNEIIERRLENMRTIQDIKNEFEQILNEVKKISGISIDSAVLAATGILAELGKYSRMQEIRSNGNDSNAVVSNGNGDQPATEKQKNALKKFGLKYRADITKKEASELLDKVISQLDNNGKGGR